MKSIIVVIIAVCTLAFACADEIEIQKTDYPAVAAAIDNTLRTHIYDPAVLETPGYKRVKAEVEALALTVISDVAFIEGFRDTWKDGPFSHVEFRKAQQSVMGRGFILWRRTGGSLADFL